MILPYRHQGILPWSPDDPGHERRFRLIWTLTLSLSLLFGLAVPFIDLPEIEHFKKQTIPPRLAQLILERKQTPPPKPPEPVEKIKKPEEKKEQPLEVEKPEPKVEPKPKTIQTPQARTDAARKKAASSGLLAFSDQLADLRDSSVNVPQRSVKTTSSTKIASSQQRAIITSTATQGSGGIDTSTLSRDTGGQRLGTRETTQVKSKVADSAKSAAVRKEQTKGSRTREEIQLVFDRNKGAIYAIYNRALRKDPTLQGKVVLELTIKPDGAVSKCRIISSELNNKALENKLVARVKLFKFPAKSVDTTVVSYPIDFLPS